jgi:hypothetical protein
LNTCGARPLASLPDAQHSLRRVACYEVDAGGTDDPANWSTYDTIWAHLGPSGAEECDDPRTRELLIDWVRYQWKIGELDSALRLARRLDELWTHHLGPDDLQTLHLRFHIGNLLRAQGQFNGARELDAQVLNRQREVHGADHPHALITANGLAADLRSLGDFQGSLALDREAYESFRRQFGEDYPRTLIAAHNLGCSLRLVGECFAARQLDEKTEDRQKRVLGHRHPYTLLSAVSLANDLRAGPRPWTWRDRPTSGAVSATATAHRTPGHAPSRLQVPARRPETCPGRWNSGPTC